MRFRPCIDLRNGRVVQVVGSSLDSLAGTVTNFESTQSATYFAERYRADDLPGGHVIALGVGNEQAALSALSAYPGGMQMGGSVNANNAEHYLKAGASHVIVTSFLFVDGHFDRARLQTLLDRVGRSRLVIDLSCRLRDGQYWVVMDRWQRFTDLSLSAASVADLSAHCAELLVHGVDVEGKRSGIEAPLVERLAEWAQVPVTYAGGVRSLEDIELIRAAGLGRVDVSVGSALDLFGGDLRYADVVAWHREQQGK